MMKDNFFNKTLLLIVLFLPVAACGSSGSGVKSVAKIEVVETDAGYQLHKNGQPFVINGAGIEIEDVESFAAHGGNVFRTWSTDNAQSMLDKASELGLMVVMCLYLEPERKGFDYDDETAVKEQLEFVREEVLKYKDHPALLSWMIGNELNLAAENPAVYNAINDVSKMIHEVDPNHPTTAALAGYSAELQELISERAPDLDFISIQMYGELALLPRYIKETNYTKPYFITEWGSIGHWEMPKTSWDAPVEQDSTAKAGNYLKSYQTVIEPYVDQVLGSFVFLWGQKQERTPTWYGMFTELGEETETVEVMHYIWNSVWPENRVPKHQSPMLLNGKNAFQDAKLSAGKTYQASVDVIDTDNDPLQYRWEIKPESDATTWGGDYEVAIDTLNGLIDDPTVSSVTLTAPQESGAYRLFVYVADDHNHAAHANIPFYVEP